MKENNNSMNAFVTNYFDEIISTNPWAGTPVERYYALPNSAKGSTGESIVESILKEKGYDVKPRTNAGHDRIINGRKTEIKFCLATKRNTNFRTTFNHIGFNKDWEDILFVCINGDGEIASALYSKDNFPHELVHHQQGGNSSGNDDFMISGKQSVDILFNPAAIKLF